MSIARPARSLVGRCLANGRAAAPVVSCQQFHSSAPNSKGKYRFQNVSAEQLGLTDAKKMAKFQKEKFPEYTKAELTQLAAKYTPEQLEAIKAAEAAIDTQDIIVQGRLRDDAYRPEYLDDYAKLDPRFDVKPEVVSKPREPEYLDESAWVDQYAAKLVSATEKSTNTQLTRAMARALRRVKASAGEEMIDLTVEELDDLEQDPDALARYLAEAEIPDKKLDPKAASEASFLTRAQALKLEDAINAEWEKELDSISKMEGTADIAPSTVSLLEGTSMDNTDGASALAPELGKIPGVVGHYKSADAADNGADQMKYKEVQRLTGLSYDEIISLYRKVLVVRFVTNQTRLGKVRSTAAVAIAGNGNGRLGLGFAKSTESGIAASTAELLAIRNMKPIRRYEDRTIYGNVKAKISGTVVELFSRPPGFGLRVPHRLFEMCRAAGIHDIAARIPRSKSPLNTVKATYEALMNQPDPEQIAIGRGKKLVDARKVYYGGAVH
ncbi:hypothetical protein VHEMI02336 [[Torrubiella] hemipterigena]|uniref:S5 DRBM domain-containing protein n=1 Tax=[Torrubiella] hemipterigena TaxID=1531966 RepID=A0A0A1T7X1_9HYPO|nr:hypothetical protein VHEMI02336 [[Torrubiella] hemipterigena]